MIEVTEVSIAQLRAALESGQTTAVELVQAYLARIDAYDGTDTPTALNAVVVRNPEALAEAQASDARRAKGQTLGPLDGIPYTAKDSYLVKGLTAASGSPAFKDLIAYRDAFTIERLRGAGAICLGKTNMPPMANGGMQRGVYGRAESPYNANYHRAFRLRFVERRRHGHRCQLRRLRPGRRNLVEWPWPGVEQRFVRLYAFTRGDFGARQLAVDADHGRGRAVRRTMADLLEVLDVVVAEDPDTRGDLWRLQPWVPIPSVASVRPASYLELAVKPTHWRASASAFRACTSTPMPKPAPARHRVSAGRPGNASLPVIR
jgi:amidase